MQWQVLALEPPSLPLDVVMGPPSRRRVARRSRSAPALPPSGRSGHAGAGREQLRDLHRVQRGALAQVVIAYEQREAATVGHALVLPDATDEARVATGGRERGWDVDELDARRTGENLTRTLGRQRARELGVDRQRVPGEDRHAHADAGDEQIRDP